VLKRLLLFAFCLAVVLAACASPVYVRPYEPTTRADSLAIHADSTVWAIEARQHDTKLGLALITGLVMIGAIILLGHS
jgi:hypothetical protein